MKRVELRTPRDVARRLAEAEATIEALLSGQIDAVVDSKSSTPVLLSKAQEALRESDERHRLIVETANEGICTIDAELKITFVNRRLAEMLGYTAEELLGRSLLQYALEATKAKIVPGIENGSENASAEREVGFIAKGGAELWALLKTSSIRDGEGRVIGTLAMMTDRTRRRHAEQALRKSEEQYRQIVEATSDGILKIDAASRIVFVNRRFAEMLGYEAYEMMGMTVLALMSVAARAAADSIQRPGDVRDAIDTTFLHKNGTEVSVNVAPTSLVDEAGKPIGTLAMVRDVTVRKKLETQLMVSDRMASVGTLAAGVAHEINNPLTAVIANLDCIYGSLAQRLADEAASLASQKLDVWFVEEIKEPLDDAREAAQRVRFIVRDLKIFSRSPAEEPRGPVDVRAIMESSLRMAWNEVRHRARLIKQYSPVPGVEANEARLGQVFLNLIVNAAQAVPEGRAEHNEIRVSTRFDGSRVIVEVSDTGAGIQPEIIGRIFDAFYTTKAVGFGTGLGLAICQRIVTDMGGELSVESEVGKGTTFRVALPIAKESDRPAALTIPPSVRGGRGRILVVDDEKLMVQAVQRVLSKEHDVTAVTAAEKVLALCKEGATFDLILCDLMMPDMTGMDLYRELSRIAPAQAEKMIFMTGGAFTAKAREFLSNASKEHIEKPFEPANLRALVRRYLK